MRLGNGLAALGEGEMEAISSRFHLPEAGADTMPGLQAGASDLLTRSHEAAGANQRQEQGETIAERSRS